MHGFLLRALSAASFVGLAIFEPAAAKGLNPETGTCTPTSCILRPGISPACPSPRQPPVGATPAAGAGGDLQQDFVGHEPHLALTQHSFMRGPASSIPASTQTHNHENHGSDGAPWWQHPSKHTNTQP